MTICSGYLLDRNTFNNLNRPRIEIYSEYLARVALITQFTLAIIAACGKVSGPTFAVINLSLLVPRVFYFVFNSSADIAVKINIIFEIALMIVINIFALKGTMPARGLGRVYIFYTLLMICCPNPKDF